MELGNIINYKKGKAPTGRKLNNELVIYLSPEYLRNKSKEVLIPDFFGKVEVKKGDLLLLWDGSNAGEFFLGKDGVLSSTMVKLIFDEKENDRTFLYYQLKFIEDFLKSQTNGSGIPHVDKEILLSIDVERFKPVEQIQIASILSKVDVAIAQTEQLISKYTRIKTGLMQDLLTKGIDEQGNIRSEATHEFKDSPLGRIPKEWEWSLIGDACYVTKLAGYEFTKYMEYRDDGEVIALRALNIKNEKLILEDVQRISQKISDFLVRSKLNKGDVLITYIGAYIGDIVQIPESNKYHLAPNIAKIVAGKKLTADFLENILRSERVQAYFKSLITTTANPSLTMGQIRKSYILFPTSSDEQVEISLKIKKMKDFINSLSMDLSKYCSLKTGLMQDLLSGKVRVNHLIKETIKA
jgi:type I restriction enzyme S subunit